MVHRWDAGGARPAPLPSSGAEARTHTVRTDDGADLRILEWGEGPPLVLVHGITATSEDWLPVLPHLLAAGHRVVALDQRGHGASTLGSGPCGTTRLAADLAQVLDALDLRDVVLVGHSLGGYVSLALAGLHRDLARHRVAVLVLLGAPYTGRGGRELATLASVAAPWTPRLQRSHRHGAVAMGLLAFGAAPRLDDIDAVRLRWAACAAATRRCFARHLAGERVTPLLDDIELPVVVARGSRDHIVTGRRQRALVHGLARSRRHEFHGAGHALLPEQPAAVAGLILDAAHRRG